MLRVRERPGEGRIMHCMHRVGGFRFNRSITVANLRTISLYCSTSYGPQELLLKLARRAIHFHDFIKEHSGKAKVDVQGKEVVPIEAGIHLPSSKANQPKPAWEKRVIVIDAQGTLEDTSGTISIASSAGQTPAKAP